MQGQLALALQRTIVLALDLEFELLGRQTFSKTMRLVKKEKGAFGQRRGMASEEKGKSS